MATILATRTELAVGDTLVRPATLEVIGPAARESVEPRVMEVLVVLIDAGGGVITRDTLIARCWGGRIVGDDAITRVIVKIRRLSEGVAAGGFAIETISKAGYRLVARGAPVSARPRAMSPRRWRVAALAALVAAGVGGIAIATRERSPPVAPVVAPMTAARDIDPASHDLEARGRALVFEGSRDATNRGIGYLREAAQSDPARAEAWGGLALGHVRSLLHAAPGDRPTVVLRIRDAVAHAFALDPHEALATAALASLEPTYRNWARKDAVLTAGLAAATGNRTAILFQRAQFLAAVGRTREALALTEQAAAISPLLPWLQAMRIDLLAATGRLEAADEVAARAARLWPRDPRLWTVRFDLKAFSGRAAEAAAMAADRTTWPDPADPRDFAAAAQAARAIRSGTPAEADAVVAADAARLAADPGTGEAAIRVAAALGRSDRAFAAIDTVYLGPDRALSLSPSRFDYLIGLPGERSTLPLFVAPAGRLWSDPRFLPAMARIGLVDYWRRSAAPDFCASPALVDACIRAGVSAARSYTRSPAAH